jgi:hypothetical protein
MLIKMINNCIKDPSKEFDKQEEKENPKDCYSDVLSMSLDGGADLIFLQSVEYKKVELYRCHFEPADEESVKNQVTYKF